MDENRKIILRYAMVCFMVLSVFALSDAKLEDHVKLCKMADPELNKCLIGSAQQLIEKLRNGIPEYNLQPIDPLLVPIVDFRKAGMGLTLVIKNSTHSGIGNIKFLESKADPRNYRFEFHTIIPKHTIQGTYSVNGKIMMLPIQGEGKTKIILHNVKGIWKIQGEPFMKNDTKFMKVKEVNVSVVPNLMEVNFENLFNGNKMLGQTLNEVLNSQWEDLYKYVKPAIEKSEAEILTEFSEKFFSQIPYKDLFLDS